MKSLNSNQNLWTEITVEELESREEYAACITFCFDCICFTFHCFCFSL
jgi:hypothetical protein